jgi:murein tripeptide amidase MpaA
MDEAGALELWQEAVKNPDPKLRLDAWAIYRERAARLARKETVPQIVRIRAHADRVLTLARASRLDVHVWSSNEDETIAAAPPYFVSRLQNEGIETQVLYDSIAAWQLASKQDDEARNLTPEYQKDSDKYQVRIAVIDLARRNAPAAGYSDWLGDVENIVMRNDRFLAYLDIFPSSVAASSRIAEYERRGYAVAGSYTTEEFSQAVSRFFPGETFHHAAKEKNVFNSLSPALSEGRFHNYEETLAEFNQLADQHPDMARVVALGSSYEGRQIFALKISRSPSVNDASKPDVLITGCHHAREWISVEPPVYFANKLIADYDSDDTVRHLVDSLEIWIVPVVNPDGLTYSQSASNDSTNSVRLWRKNRRPVSFEGCPESTGVDLNRNYDFQWRLPGDEPCPTYNDDIGGSDDPTNEIFRGSAPESEPEIKAIKTLIDDPAHNFRAELDYHNFSQLILYPWGYQSFDAPDEETLASLAAQMSTAISRVEGRSYRPRQAVELYSTTGSSIDYAYGARQIAAPFIIEMRPVNGRFDVPESQIAGINEENWAAAKVLMRWAAGPPILESVRAYQKASDGSFSKQVYSARWTNAGGGRRQLRIETDLPGIETGPLQIRLQFSKPMNSQSPPVATLNSGEGTDELRLAARDITEGWQETRYANDTWAGQVDIPQMDEAAQWQLAVSAIDGMSFKLDAKPETVADYLTGTNHWGNYEDSNGEGREGGADRQHLLAPRRGDRAEIIIGSPVGGERLARGEAYTVEWSVIGGSGFSPAEQEIWISTNGGINYERILAGIGGQADKAVVNLPPVATTTARVRIVAIDGGQRGAIFADGQRDFSICANVGAAMEARVVSSQQVDQSWVDASENPPRTGSSRLVINLRVTNRGSVPIAAPFLRVGELTRNHTLLSRDAKSDPAVGARQSLEAGEDGLLSANETADARIVLGLVSKKKFKFGVELYGVPVDGAISGATPARVWNGKPKSK